MMLSISAASAPPSRGSRGVEFEMIEALAFVALCVTFTIVTFVTFGVTFVAFAVAFSFVAFAETFAVALAVAFAVAFAVTFAVEFAVAFSVTFTDLPKPKGSGLCGRTTIEPRNDLLVAFAGASA